MSGFRSLNNSMSKRVLNLLEPVKLTVWKVMIERVTVVKFRVNSGGGNGAGCFEVKVRADTAKFTDVIVARLRKCSDLIREGKVFVKNKTKVASRVGCSERAVLYDVALVLAGTCVDRHVTCGCFLDDSTRVVLSGGEDYINASHITVSSPLSCQSLYYY